MSYLLGVVLGASVFIVFYLLYLLAHVMDFSVRTFSGGRQKLIFDMKPGEHSMFED
ncbi:MAG: hypothetical protein GF334_08880 [Candidatus Altiarchaeales archaeon]|nr:hypothetical protein [Candidatus Altiarchaeales archaeon]